MIVEELSIPDVKIFSPTKHGDHRGFFSEVYNKKTLVVAGIDIDFVQDNHSLSAERGTVRGLHFQTPPFAQHKLVRVVRGCGVRRRRRFAPGVAFLWEARNRSAFG